MCSNQLAVGLQFTVAGAVSHRTDQFGFAVVATRSSLQHILEVQACVRPLALTLTSSVCHNGSARSFGPSTNCFDTCFDTEVINVTCLLLWTQAACKQVAKHQQDEIFPPPIPTPKPYKTRHCQQSKQMFYICCAFWVQAVLFFFHSFYLEYVAVRTNIFFPYTSCLIAWHSTVRVSLVFSREK